MASVSKFSLEPFDSNACLNCSVMFTNNDETETPKIQFLGVLDDEDEEEAVSVWSALNTVFQIPVSRQIGEQDGEAFGCCPACSTLLGELYEVHRKLQKIRSLDSVVTKFLEERQANLVEMDPDIMPIESHEEEDPLRLTPEDLKQTATAEVVQPTVTEIPNIQIVRSSIPSRSATTEKLKCLNCCAEIQYLKESEAIKNPAVKQAIWAISIPGEPNKIQVDDILNRILKLPPQNYLTAGLKICIDCARILIRIYIYWNDLKGASKLNSRLNFIFQKIQSFIDEGCNRNPSITHSGNLSSSGVSSVPATAPRLQHKQVNKLPPDIKIKSLSEVLGKNHDSEAEAERAQVMSHSASISGNSVDEIIKAVSSGVDVESSSEKILKPRKGRRAASSVRELPLRLTGRHFPSELPNNKRRRCHMCYHSKPVGNDVKSYYVCIPCEKTLCIYPCFEDYHTKEDLYS